MFIFTNQTALLKDEEPIEATIAAHDSTNHDGNIGTVLDREHDSIHVVVYQESSDTWISDARKQK